MQRIMEVTKVTLAFGKAHPPQIIVYAEGLVPTSGWKNPSLGAWKYISTPEDGIQDFDFVAEEPTGLVLQVVSPIAAQLTASIDPTNYWGNGRPLNGIRIHARNGPKEAVPEADLLNDWVPWPWAW